MSVAAIAAAKAKKRRAQKKKAMEEKKRKQGAALDAYMAKYDVSQSSTLNQDEFKALLTDLKRDLLEDPSAEVSPEVLEEMMEQFDVSKDGEIERKDLAAAIMKYRAYLCEAQQYQELLEKHDTDNTGRLTPEQLLTLLEELATVKNVPKPDEADVEFVIEQCDNDQTGTINVKELKYAISTWWNVAKGMDQGGGDEGPPPSPCCTIA